MKFRPIVLIALLALGSCDKGGSGGQEEPAVVSKVSIDNVALFEGDEGMVNFEFTISLDKVSSKEINITYSTADGSAKSGNDFTALNDATITIKPGEQTKKVVVSVIGDKVKEEDENFNVVIKSTTNASIQKATGVGTINNDDAGGVFNNLVWSEDFNGPTLNPDVWTYELGDGCPNVCGWGNNELEYYTNRPENLYFDNGNMIIEARKENMGGKNYTSARIISRNKKTFKFGRIEIRAKLPKGKGIWPALWLLPQASVYGNWPKSGELDMMELVGHEPNKVYGTVHFGPGPGSTQISNGYTLPGGTFNDDFHVFSIIWDLNEIKWLVDGNVYSTVTKSSVGSNTYPFNEEFFFIINLAVGGNWPGSPDSATTFPQQLFVDYIRVYQ